MSLLPRAICIIAVVAAAAAATGDEIVLKRGKTVNGLIVRETTDHVVISVPSGTISLRKSDIERIERASEGENLAIAAQLEISHGNLVSGLEFLHNAMAKDAPLATIAETLFNSRDALLLRTDSLSVPQRNTIANIAEQAAGDETIPPTTRFWLLYLSANASDSVSALDHMNRLPGDFFETSLRERQILRDFISRKTKELSESGNLNNALLLVEKAKDYVPDFSSSTRALLLIQKGAAERNDGASEKALATYANELFPIAPSIAKNRFLLTIDTMLNEAQTEEDFVALLDAIERYEAGPLSDALITKKNEIHESYGSLLLNTGKIEKAAEIFSRLMTGKSALYAALCEYEQTRRALADDDYEGWYNLGVFCKEHDLYDEANQAFLHARESTLFSQNAGRQIKLLQEKEALETLSQAHRLYEEERFFEVLDALADYDVRFPNSDLKYDAKELEKSAINRIEDEKYRVEYRAQVLFQQAERSFMRGDLSACMAKIEEILSSYRDTTTASRAVELLQVIKSDVSIDYLERGRQIAINRSDLPVSDDAETSDRIKNEITNIFSNTGLW